MFSARNERASLPAKLKSIRELDYPREKLQVLIASDASTDGTSEYLLEQDDVETLVLETRRGKNEALNRLYPKAKGEVFFFTDANTLFHPQCLRAAARHFHDPKVGSVVGELIFAHKEGWNPVGQGTGLYWRYENYIKRLENQLGSVLVGGGSLLLMRRELMQPLDPQIANDVEIPTRVGAKGYDVLYEPNCLGSERPHTDVWEELRRTSRIVARGSRGFVMLFGQFLKAPMRLWQFVSHKVLRWFALPMALVLYVCSWILREQWFPCLVFYAGSIALGCALIGTLTMKKGKTSRILRPFSLLAHVLIMHAAAFWGIALALTGRSPAMWKIPESSREK